MIRWKIRSMWAAVLLVTVVLVSGAAAQTPAEADRLEAEVKRLYRAGKHSEAIPLAQRALAIREKALGPDHLDVAIALNNLALAYKAQFRYGEAEALYKRSLAIREKVRGPEHRDVATALYNLAALYDSQGRYDEAELLLKRSLAIDEKALGPDDPDVASDLNDLAAVYERQGRYSEAEPLLRRSLAIREKAHGPDHRRVATALNSLAALIDNQGRYGEAEQLYKRSLAIREKTLGPDHPDVATALNNLAALYKTLGLYSEAEPLLQRCLAIDEKALGPDHPDVATDLNNLAALYKTQGRYREAEPLYKRSLAIREKAFGPDHFRVATALNNLAALYDSQGHYADAEPLYKRGLSIDVKVLGPDHQDVGTDLNNLALLYKAQGKYAEAEGLYQRSLTIAEKVFGPDHPDVATVLNNLAESYRVQGKYAEAEPLYKRALEIDEKVLGPDHPGVAIDINNLAALYDSQGRYGEAEPLYKRSLAINEAALRPDHPRVATALSNLALLTLAKNDFAAAAELWSRAAGITADRAERGLGNALSGSFSDETQRHSSYFHGLVKTTHRIAAHDRGNAQRLASEMFETAQWGQSSEAATSLAQTAARSARGSPALAALVRERQDLVAEWQGKDKRLIAFKSKPPQKRNAAAETELANRLAAIDRRLAEIDAVLARDFPDYAGLASPKPIGMQEVQAQLRDDEALVLFLDTDARFKPLPEETFVWVVTKTDARWVRSGLGTAALQREVAALRCGLDHTAWDYPKDEPNDTADITAANAAQRAQADACLVALKVAPEDRNGRKILPFDAARAHALYKSLFSEVEDLIKGKSLLVVPSGALTQLPFHVLVTEAPPLAASLNNAEHRKIAWLIREHAVTVLPAVSSLKSLRRVGKPSAARRPMIGFGNPLLDGPHSGYARLAKAARERQQCPQTLWERVASLAGGRAGVAPIETRGGLAKLSHLKAQTPLPETADELCAVAGDLGADKGEMRLGARTTETEIKRLSEEKGDGRLANYRLVHFATHGTLAGQISGTTEPGLILTPPDEPTEADDGFLTAAEITDLKLDADWVILSACNTAGPAGGAEGAEALSGLARAFFYAQARALLVSHWEVDSNATVKLITSAVRALDAKTGRAAALQKAMLSVIDTGKPHEAHPAYWAPFVVVGEGAVQDTSASSN